MRRFIYILSIAAFACSSSEDLSVAHGHFEAEELLISPEVPGKIVRYLVEDGMKLNAGDTIAVIDTLQLYIQKQQAKASIEAIRSKTLSVSSEIAVVEANRKYLASEVERVRKLVQAEAATKVQLDEMLARLEQVERQKEALEIKLRNTNRGILAEIEPVRLKISQLEDQIRRAVVLSPSNSTVLSTYSNYAEMAAPGKPLCSLADMQEMELRVYMTARQLKKVSIGSRVAVSYNGEETTDGTISYISQEAEFTPKNIQTAEEQENLVYGVVAKVSNNGQLRIGMPGSITLSDD